MPPLDDPIRTPDEPGRWCRAGWLVPLGLIGLWLLFIARNYEIHSYSDPLNWLRFARNFEAEIHTSKFALGFAVFLRGALGVLGPFCVFLVNAPVLLAAYLLSALLAVRLLKKEAGILPWQVVTLALAIFFSFDRMLVLKMVNPFRDPLSYLLLIGAVLQAAQHAESGGARFFRPALSGLLLGLACCVREPSILMVIPFGIFALWSWRADSRIRFWRDAALFGAGLLVGLLPLAGQSLISTGQALLPPQSSVEQRLIPGMHFNSSCSRINTVKAYEYYVKSSPWSAAGVVTLWAGLVAGLRKRHRLVLSLLILPTLLFLVFYIFYWAFVPRYFYSAMVFAVPGIVWALMLFLRWATRHVSSPRHRSAVRSAVMIGLAAISGMSMASCRPAGPKFQIPQARLLAAELERRVPAGSLVFARRHMCEAVEWFSPADSFPATGLIPADVPAEEALRRELPAWVSARRPVFLIESRTRSGRETDAALMDRICGLDFICDLPAERFHLKSITGSDSASLFRVRNMQPAPRPRPGAEQARQAPVRFDFSLQADSDASSALVGERQPATLARPAPRMLGRAEIDLPGPIRADEHFGIEVRLRSPVRGEGQQRIEMEMGGETQEVRLRKDRTWQITALRGRGPSDQPVLHLRSTEPFDLHYVDYRIAPPSDAWTVEVGRADDFVYLRDGWYDREDADGRPARWSKPVARVDWTCVTPAAPGRIDIESLSRADPPNRPPPRIWCNETELKVQAPVDVDPSMRRWTAEIPEGVLQPQNIIRIEREGWTPSPKDRRSLGLFVHRIVMRATPVESHP